MHPAVGTGTGEGQEGWSPLWGHLPKGKVLEQERFLSQGFSFSASSFEGGSSEQRRVQTDLILLSHTNTLAFP